VRTIRIRYVSDVGSRHCRNGTDHALLAGHEPRRPGGARIIRKCSGKANEEKKDSREASGRL
jgi:hypothetical protein